MRLSGRSFQSLGTFFTLLFLSAGSFAQVLDSHPLAPPDTSSPRATLRSFVTAVDMGLMLEMKSTLSYLASDRLYPNESENRLKTEAERNFALALETLDISELPSGFRQVLAVEQAIRLSEILSRLDLPGFEEVPDYESMQAQGKKQWTIPNTRIEISLLKEGSRQGEYVFSAETVAHLGEFYSQVTELPYKSGALQQFVEALRPYTSATTLYDIYRNATTDFGVLPGRWMLGMPTWLSERIGGVAVWKWFSLVAFGLLFMLLIILARVISRRLGANPQWRLFLTTAIVAAFAGLMIPLCTQLHISGRVLYTAGITSVITFYVVAAWAAFIGAGAISETIVHAQQLRTGTIDSQLIRLGARLIGLVIAIALLIEGADELGFPAYSVLTGLGIGGLAFALAARETLANLLGSIVIMFEKPFRSGHWIKIGEAEGTVEFVGFRSTRIRTFEDSLISIPNSLVVNSVVDNFGMRGSRRQQFVVQITYDTTREKVQTFVNGIRQIIADHPMTDKEVAFTYFNNLGESGLEILLYFHLRVQDYTLELQEREMILLKIMGLAKELDVEFAYPTRTLHINATPDKIE